MTVSCTPAPSVLTAAHSHHALRATRLVASSLLSIALALGCGDSESGTGTGGTGAANGTAGTGGGAPRSTALLATQRIFTTDNRFIAAQVVSELDGQELDPSQSLELSGFSRTYVFGGKLFVFDGETLQVTRYAIDDDLRLTEDGRFSMMGVGVTSFAPTTVFINPTRAIYIGREEIAVVFDPEAMVITSTFDVPGLAKEGLIARFNAPIRVGDNLYMAIAWWNGDTFEVHPAVAAAVLSAEEDRFLGIAEDSRCVFSDSGFAADGAYYVVGNNFSGAIDLATPEEFPPPCLLRLREGATEFDADFYVDLAESTGTRLLGGLELGIGDGRYIGQVYGASQDPSELDSPSSVFGENLFRYALFSVSNGLATVVDDLPLTARNNFFPALIDGIPYVPINDGFDNSQLFRIDPETRSAEIALQSSAGQIIGLQRIR